MMNNNTAADIARQLHHADKIAVFCHVRPDGDALGSGLALVKALVNAGKDAYMICEDEVPERLKIFPAMGEVRAGLPYERDQFDLFVSVDCAELARMGAFALPYSKFRGATVNVDHHVSNSKYGKYNYVYECTATCELMPELFEAAGFEITTEIADLLALGLVTDSGNFVHKDVSAKTFAVASLLRECGADFPRICYEMFSRQTKTRALLYARVLAKMRFALDDKLAILTIAQNDLKELDADKSLTEGFVDFPLTIDEVEVSVALMEVKKGQYKASLRSKSVNVNTVASAFGGGGHVLASGCMLFGEYEEVVEKLTYAVYQHL